LWVRGGGASEGLLGGEHAERWTVCAAGHEHWGALGGAGLLLRYAPPRGRAMFLLAQRSQSVDEPGCWGIPGGACRDGEMPEATALRELREELVSVPAYEVAVVDAHDCGGGWLFWVIVADVDHRAEVFCGEETETTGWFTHEQLLDLRLHRGLRLWLERHAV
jgi:ADP-ribose pyrophosphatase YjhB (NUDIX family)